MNRRQFMQSAFYSSLLYGGGTIPRVINSAYAGFSQVNNPILINLMLDGGPDLRHLIVPAWTTDQSEVGYHYWKYRWRAHRLANESDNVLQARWEDDYFKITVGGQNWGGNVDSGGLNDGVTFGIWKEAGWLIDMFLQGKVAIFCNAVGGRNRNHSLSTIQLEQGNLAATSSIEEHSGWGGRLARHAGGNAIALTNTPRRFCFGPDGSNIARVDNSDLISVQDSRNWGLYEFRDAMDSDHGDRAFDLRQKLAGNLEQYYATLQNKKASTGFGTDIWDNFLDHENKIREFGEALRDQLDFPIPTLIRALYDNRGSDGEYHSENNGPGGAGPNDARRVLRSTGFGRQIRNLFDVLAGNDASLLNAKVTSLSYGGWDTHGNQRQVSNNLDNNNPNYRRGIESNLRDIFGGYLETGTSHLTTAEKEAQPHCAFSALWEQVRTTSPSSVDNLLFSIAGEFGRQIRDNRDNGTDHGKGNNMFLIGSGVNGGIYGEMFPLAEIDRLNDSSIRTPDIDPRTDIERIFGPACDWVSGGSANTVFPTLIGGTPDAEAGVNHSSIFS
ncbi:MAG: DUF1501 domain-containing protein [Acidiferrobacterales bacterium]|nr:DUF1501 domain-containing protein [Acidiferrobacterales bacterium]